MFKSLVVALALAALATPAHAASPNDVKALVYGWFGLFDGNAPTDAFLERLADDGLDVTFPESTLRSDADFAAWYAGIQATFATATHDVRTLTVTRNGAQDGLWTVDLTVFWHADAFDGSVAQGLFHQIWTVRESADRLEIVKNVITPVES